MEPALTALAPWAQEKALAATVAQARNRALTEAGYPPRIRMPRAETVDGWVSLAARMANIGDAPVRFSPSDHCMVFCVQREDGEDGESRAWRILIADAPANDKRGRVRKWGSSQAALREARKIEREMLNLPKRKRIGTKAAAPPPGPLLALMGHNQ